MGFLEHRRNPQLKRFSAAWELQLMESQDPKRCNTSGSADQAAALPGAAVEAIIPMTSIFSQKLLQPKRAESRIQVRSP